MNRLKIITLFLLVLALIALGRHQLSKQAFDTNLVAYAQATATPTPTPTPTPPPPPLLGRMTGGGSVFIGGAGAATKVTGQSLPSGTRVTHGLEIHCGNPPISPNTLEVNWPGASEENNFHLENLTLGVCILDPAINGPKPPVAPFNTFIGAGTGRFNGVAGASISFIFTDQGEPGTSDTESMIISDSFNNVVLTVPTTALTFGNHQAHNANPNQ